MAEPYRRAPSGIGEPGRREAEPGSHIAVRPRKTELVSFAGSGGIRMNRKTLSAFLSLLVCFSAVLAAQEKKPTPPKRVAIRAGHLIDGKSDNSLDNVIILIEDDKIVAVTPGGAPPGGAELLDLSTATVLPGFFPVQPHLLPTRLTP